MLLQKLYTKRHAAVITFKKIRELDKKLSVGNKIIEDKSNLISTWLLKH